jgi:hypothetical protein
MPPEALERFRPLVKRTNRFGIRLIEHMPAVAPYADEADIEQDVQVLGNGRLRPAQRSHDVTHRALVNQKAEDGPPTRFGDGVEGIGGCGSARHERNNTFLYGNM